MIRLLLISLFCLLIISTSVSAEIPQVISYQGKVTEDGSPAGDDDYPMIFTIYNAETSGTSQWSSGSMIVSVSDGIFSVLLGDTGQPPLDIEFDDEYWLETDINGDVQSPRSRLCSVGYAYMASGLIAGTEVAGSVTSGTSSAIKGANTATSDVTYGIYGQSFSTEGRGVYGAATATSGSTYGVYGHSYSTGGRGVYGYAGAASGTTYGVYGRSYSTNGRGVCGHAEATSGTTYGVYGHSWSTNGRGVYGYAGATSGTNSGIYGRSNSTDGRAVYGYASATSGTTFGGHFESTSHHGRGVYGYTSASSGSTYGIYGESSSTDGHGVFGWATAGSGLTYGVNGRSFSPDGRGVNGLAYATSGVNSGVYGESYSTDGRGVFGWASAGSGQTYGVYGTSESPDGRGVFGYASQSTGNGQGVRGESDSSENGVGVYGLGSSTTGLNYGVFGRSHSSGGYGVYGAGVPGGYALYASGDFAASGTKSCVVKTSQGPTLMYCQESPENWFEDFGEGQLLNGRCHIDLDPVFLETVTIDDVNPMKVYVTPNGSLGDWWVEKGDNDFSLVAHDAFDGTRFDYRIVAKRKGFESNRLDYCKAAETDSHIYPELREKELRELKTERMRSESISP